MVSDEVITGFGRTGTMFGFEHWGVKPDLIQYAKAITSGYFPLGGIGVSDEIAQTMEESGKPRMHAYTYSAHPTGCAVALAMLDIIEGEDFPGQAKKKGQAVTGWSPFSINDHPHVGDIRGLGMMCAVEYVKDPTTGEMFPPEDGIGARIHDETWPRNVQSSARRCLRFSTPDRHRRKNLG
ncbi:MAG: hypothetical protein CM1200mP41_11860 [Gammaproteobacteria bacterium]|nr:MAG: hypothetical protein CM1200mP41_11860 [Gammaproteobacteria bacterium]